MTLHDFVLLIHIVCGAGGIILGPVAMNAQKRRGLHTRVGEIYHWLFVVILLTTIVLSLMNWQRFWFLLPVGIGSYGFALLGYAAAKLRWKNWLAFHITGQGGSYIAMTTAVLVVNAGIGSWWAWVLPTIIGSPIIFWVRRHVRVGLRPKLA